jgi:hypothetical protein
MYYSKWIQSLNPVPGGITGPPCSWGIEIWEPGPPGLGESQMRQQSMVTGSERWVSTLQISDPSSRQRGRPTETRPQISDSNIPTGSNIRSQVPQGCSLPRHTGWLTDRQSQSNPCSSSFSLWSLIWHKCVDNRVDYVELFLMLRISINTNSTELNWLHVFRFYSIFVSNSLEFTLKHVRFFFFVSRNLLKKSSTTVLWRHKYCILKIQFSQNYILDTVINLTNLCSAGGWGTGLASYCSLHVRICRQTISIRPRPLHSTTFPVFSHETPCFLATAK